MKAKSIITVVFIAWQIITKPLLADVSYSIRYLTTNQGLPQNTVNSILRDQTGYMWFATGNGLNRYDGYSHINFWKPDLPSNLVNALAESEDNMLWIGTSEGLVSFDQKLNHFSNINLLVEGNIKPNVISLFADKKGSVWAGTAEHGLFIISHDGDGLSITSFTSENSQLPGNNVSSFLEMKDGRILIGTNHGIAVADNQGEGLYNFGQGNLDNALILSMFESREGDLWVGTFNGLWVYNPINGSDQWYQHNPLDPSSLSHNRVNDITQDFRGNIYIGTLGGVDVFQPLSNSFEAFPYKSIEGFSLNSIFINCIEIDNEGNVWIGTEKGGVNFFNLYQKPFHYMIKNNNDPNSLSSNTINSIYGEKDIIWIGTAGGGLNQYNRKTKQFKHFTHQPGNPKTIPSDYITAITKIPGANIWVGTWGSGLAKMMPDGTFVTFIPPVVDPETGFENSFISSLLYDSRGYLFIGTEGGLAILDLSTESFIKLSPNSNALAHISEIGCLIRDRKDNLWIGTRNGLYSLSAKELNLPYNAACPESQLRIFRNDSDNPLSLPGNYITDIREDKDGNLWLGTYGDGLVKAETNAEGEIEFRRYTKLEGLSNNVIYAIQEDAAGNIWVSTDYGLSRVNPVTDRIDNYFSDDGLLSDQFYWSASYKSEAGELFFGSINGINHFFPTTFPVYPHEPKVTLSSLRVFNSPVDVGDKRHGKVVLNQSLPNAEEISLSYKDNVFSVEFSALDYFLTRKIRYAYQLEGIDRDWVELTSDQRSASYTNLKGGSYRFRVKASNGEGEWGKKETTLLITIRPPFWQTTWFLSLLVIAMIVGAFLYIKHHTRRLLLEKDKLEKVVRERTRRIEVQNQQLQTQAEELEDKNSEIMLQRDRLIKLNKEIESINQNRMRFFTNISHEFRTPLTLIISPVERLLSEIHLPGLAHELLSSVQRNARRLNLLIDQLLMFRKIETGNILIRITNNNISSFISEIFHAFDLLAQQRKIEYSKIIELPEDEYWYDEDKIENILYNLLSNAFKYTPEGGKISLLVHKQAGHQDNKPSLSIEVCDSGVGLNDEQMEKIFDRFYRSPNNGQTIGSGIGLALTRELVEVMSGSIVALRNEEKGSKFIVTLPFRKEDFPGAEINDLPAHDVGEINNKIMALADNLIDEEPFLEAPSSETPETASILVVEDNKELALFIANSLSGQYNVLVAKNGKTGYEMARKNSPELIIADVMMPEMNGIEMCRQIKGNLYTSHIPVIMLSAKALLEDQLEGFQYGADDYISKPFNLDLLKAKVHNAIEARRRMRKLFTSQTNIPDIQTPGQSLDDKFLAKAYEVLEKSYSNPDFSVEAFSDSMFVSRSLLYKKIKALIDLSPNDFITIYRLKKALPLLMSKEMSVNEVAYSVGFNDPKYFGRVFKRIYKKTPGEYLI